MAQADEIIQVWASGVFDDLGQPANTSTSTISGYAVQVSTLGKLNNLLTTCFSGSGYTGAGSSNYQIGPSVTNTELAIINQMYLVSYFANLAQATMGIGGNTIPWLNLSEGDSKIGRVNAASIGAQYMAASKEANVQLQYLANAYRNGSAGVARSVDYLNPSYGVYVGGNGGQSYTGPR